jgi:hypothetical protein
LVDINNYMRSIEANLYKTQLNFDGMQNMTEEAMYKISSVG